MTITHGILTPFGIFNSLIHEMNEISGNNIRRENKKVNWKKTNVFDNSQKAQYQKLTIYREVWR